jgi:hypothetical protein
MHLRKIFPIFFLLPFVFNLTTVESRSQTVVDKTVASVGDAVRDAELITYSDLLWQLALQPGAPLAPARKEDLNEVLQLVIEQRLIALEAVRLPTVAPNDEEVEAEVRRVLEQFSSAAEFETRLRQVGFDSINDPNFRRIMEQRVAIEKFLDFRFRSFVVITPEEEDRFYRETFAPRFRTQNPGVVVPTLEQARASVNSELTESKIAIEIRRFLEEARARASVALLEPV